MKWASILAGLVLVMAGSVGAAEKDAAAGDPRVALQTTQGRIVLELAPEKAPKTTANFLRYVTEGFYDGTIFHRVIPGFMIQGGGFTPDMEKKPAGQPVDNEADVALENRRGTVAMARTMDPNSATSQFFINVADNDFLDHRSKTPRGWGYTAFGRVVDGMEVVDAIAGVKTGARGAYRDVPETPVVIEKARVVSSDGS